MASNLTNGPKQPSAFNSNSSASRAAQFRRAKQRAIDLHGDSLNELNSIRKNLNFILLNERGGPTLVERFAYSVVIDGKTFIGKGQSQNEAKMHAASLALKEIKNEPKSNENNDGGRSDGKSISSNFNNNHNKSERNSRSSSSYGNKHNNSLRRAKVFYGHALDDLEKIRKNITFSYIEFNNSKYKFSLKVDEKEFFGKGDTKCEAKMQAAAQALESLDPNGEEIRFKENEQRNQTLSNISSVTRLNHYRLSVFRARKMYGNALNELEETRPSLTYSLLSSDDSSSSYSIKVDGKEFFGKGSSKLEAKMQAAFEALKIIKHGKDCSNKNIVEEPHESYNEYNQAEDVPLATMGNDWHSLVDIYPNIEFKIVKTVFSLSVEVNGRTFIGRGESLDDAKKSAATLALKRFSNDNDDDDIKPFSDAYKTLNALLPKLEYLSEVEKDSTTGKFINMVTVEIEGFKLFMAKDENEIDARNKVAAIILRDVFCLVYSDEEHQ